MQRSQLLQTILRGKGIRISDDDPLFVLLVLNKIVIENSIKHYRKMVRVAENELKTCEKSKEHKTRFGIPLLIAACLFCILIAEIIGARNIDLPFTIVGLIGVLLGAFIGVLGSLFANKRVREPMELAVPAIQPLKSTSGLWTEVEFNNCVNNMISKIEDRTRQACRDILINGMDINEAASKHYISPTRIDKTIIKLKETKNQIQ